MKIHPILLILLLVGVATGTSGCKTAQVKSEQVETSAPLPKPKAVYVMDFELGVQRIKQEGGLLSGRPGVVGRVGQRLSGNSSDPEARAREIVELMASSLVKELSKAGFNTVRLPAGAAMPAQGWLLRGVFTEVDEGNRVRRAMVGFGEGKTDIQVNANVQDLGQGPPKPIYAVATDASSANTPGAAPTLVLSPYGAAARFVMAGHDLEKNVKQTAAQIAQRIAARVQSP